MPASHRFRGFPAPHLDGRVPPPVPRRRALTHFGPHVYDLPPGCGARLPNPFRKGYRVKLAVVFVGLLAGLWCEADAVPRYAARYGQNCSLCHHDPSGGGLRSLYASQYLVPTEMAWRALQPDASGKIRPDLSESVTIGADLRTLHLYADEEPAQNFFQMQGDVYVAFQADARWSALVDLDQTSSYEIFGLGHVLPHGGYVKFGRFIPLYGWKFADHNMFVREELGFDQPRNTDAGVEVGIFPGRWAFHLGGFNGNTSTTFFDSDRNLAFAGTAQYRLGIAGANLGLGLSYLRNNRDPAGGERSRGGAHGYAHYRRFVWLWEVDGTRFDPRGTGVAIDGVVVSQEASLALHPGFDLVATYNFSDTDIDRQTGTRSRFGIGVDVLATPFVNLQVMANNYQYELRPGDVRPRNHWRSEVQLHLFY